MYGGSFWMSNASGSSNAQLESLLASSDVTLQRVLEDEGVIQEAKNENAKLIEFLLQPTVLSELLTLVTTEPSSELSSSERFRLSNTASEVLSCEISKLKDEISSSRGHLEVLYRPLTTRDTALNPLLASFLCKTFSMLIIRKCEQNLYSYHRNYIQVIDFLRERNLVQDVVAHLDTSAITDLLICLLNTPGVLETKRELLQWLDDQKLIENVVQRLSPEYGRGHHDHAARLLLEIVRIARANRSAEASERIENDPLLAKIQSKETVQTILEVILRCPEGVPSDLHESSIVSGLTMLQGLLEVSLVSLNSIDCLMSPIESRGNSEMDQSAEEKQLVNVMVTAILPSLDKLITLLRNPPKKDAVQTTCGTLHNPLGFTRLHIAKFLNVLLATRMPSVQTAMVRCSAINQLLDLFFEYPLNNFLHSTVLQIVSKVAMAENIVMDANPKNPVIANDSISSDSKNIADKSDIVLGSTLNSQKEDSESETVHDEGGSSNIMETTAYNSSTEETEVAPENSTQAANDSACSTIDSTKSQNNDSIITDKSESSEGKVVEDNEGQNANSSLGETFLLKEEPLNHFFLDHVIVDCRLLERILSADVVEARSSSRICYLGHLRKLANLIVSLTQNSDGNDNGTKSSLSTSFDRVPEVVLTRWKKYVEEDLQSSNALDVITPPKIFQGIDSIVDEDRDDGQRVYSTFCLATDVLSARPNRDAEVDEDEDLDVMDMEEPCRNLDEMSDLFGGVTQTEQVFEALTQLSSGFEGRASELMKKTIADLPESGGEDNQEVKKRQPKARPSTPTAGEDDKMIDSDDDDIVKSDVKMEDDTVVNDTKMDVVDIKMDDGGQTDHPVRVDHTSGRDSSNAERNSDDDGESFDPEKDAIKDINPWGPPPSSESPSERSDSNWAAFDSNPFRGEKSQEEEKREEESWAKFN